MDKTEQILLRLYTVLVGLYPRQFRQEFEDEMNTVFGEALSAARHRGRWTMLQLCSREYRALPGALMREYGQLRREKEMEMRNNHPLITNRENFDPGGRKKLSTHGRGEIFLAALPFVLILVADVLPKILVEAGLLSWEAPAWEVLNTTLSVLLIATFLLIIILGWHQKWPTWSASWFPFFALVPFGLVSWLLNLLLEKNSATALNLQSIFLYQLIPLMVAVLLYAVTRIDRVRGLLAALPVLYILWSPNMEFVADPIEVSIKIISSILICLAIAFILRRGDWRSGFLVILAVNLVIGFLYSYAGSYHGGTLPFTASGPNIVEVLRSLIPQYLATSAILLGPLFAWMFRQEGLASGRVGKFSYHLVLAGLFLVIIANLAGLMVGLEYSSTTSMLFSKNVLVMEIILGLASYGFGIYLLYKDSRQFGDAYSFAERLLLIVLPLALPIALVLPFFSWRISISRLYGIPLLWKLPHDLAYTLGVIWLLLSVWLITRKREDPTLLASLVDSPEAPSSSIIGV
jgi:hypothetical protein